MRISEWAQALGVTVQSVPGAIWRVKDVFTTRDGSWEPSGKRGSVPQWARDAYLKPVGHAQYNDDGGADHHIFGAIADGGALLPNATIHFWTHTDNSNHIWQPVKKHGWANVVLYPSSNFVPERGEVGPWAWAPDRGDIVKGAGMPAKEHVSFWAVWEKAAETQGFVTADIGLNLRAHPNTNSGVLVTMAPGATVTIHQRQGDWYEVTYKERRGWAFAQYISEGSVFDQRFERAFAFVIKWEGKFSTDKNDAGNWTGNAVGVGEMKGTKYGISAAAYPHLDIANLTIGEAKRIYHQSYWLASGADKLTGDLALIHFDTAVNMGVGQAKIMLRDSKETPLLYLGRRLHFYTTLQGWANYGAGWARRVADLMSEVDSW